MSQLTAPERLAYDDLATLEEMYGDCLAAGRNLPDTPSAHQADSPARPATPAIEVPVETALMASALHLHLH